MHKYSTATGKYSKSAGQYSCVVHVVVGDAGAGSIDFFAVEVASQPVERPVRSASQPAARPASRAAG